jgi:predicted CoA-binding protein
MISQKSSETVAIIGASPKPDRYAFKAMELLKQYGHKPVPVNPTYPEILGEKCYPDIAAVPEPIETVTLYLGPARSNSLIDEILSVGPKRIIMNPGAENETLAAKARDRGIEAIEGCTLMMLRTGTF